MFKTPFEYTLNYFRTSFKCQNRKIAVIFYVKIC